MSLLSAFIAVSTVFVGYVHSDSIDINILREFELLTLRAPYVRGVWESGSSDH